MTRTTAAVTSSGAVHRRTGSRRSGDTSTVLLFAVFIVLVAALAATTRLAAGRWDEVSDAVVIGLAVVVQATPFVVAGAVAGGAVTWATGRFNIAGAMPRGRFAGAVVGTLCSAVVVGCECASVTIGQRLTDAGVSRSAALAVMFAAPAVNPIVVVATLVALPGQAHIAVARVVGGAVLAVIAAVIVDRFWPAATEQIAARGACASGQSHRHSGGVAGQVADDAIAGIGVVAGAAVAVVAVKTVVAVTGAQVPAAAPVVAVMVAAAIAAMLLAVCSASDAFIAASFPGMPPAAVLTFLLVGPAVDIKLTAMHARAFGVAAAWRIAVVVLAVALPLAGVLAVAAEAFA